MHLTHQDCLTFTGGSQLLFNIVKKRFTMVCRGMIMWYVVWDHLCVRNFEDILVFRQISTCFLYVVILKRTCFLC